MGMVALRPDGHKADMGYVLGRVHWGQGLMVDAARVVVDAAFLDPALLRVWAVSDVDNRASARVLEKLGVVREGLIRSWLLHPNVSPVPRDVLVFAQLNPGASRVG